LHALRQGSDVLGRVVVAGNVLKVDLASIHFEALSNLGMVAGDA
jgi:hypothetical protein